MLGKRRWVSLTLAASLATFGLGLTAAADTESEAGFVAQINASRSANGLAPLAVDAKLRTHARDHTEEMMAAGYIFHSSGAELSAAGSPGWTVLGENVGVGGTVSSLHQAFMDSPTHRDNILGDFNYVGVGSGTKDGTLYVTVLFMHNPTMSGATTTTTNPTTTSSAPTTTTTAPATTTTVDSQTTTTTALVTTTTSGTTQAPSTTIALGQAGHPG